MLKRALLVAIAALAISIPTMAGAAGKKHKVKSYVTSATAVIANINPPGGVNVGGSQTFAGTIDGKIGGKAETGALRGTNTYTAAGTGATFTGTLTVFGTLGSYSATLTGSGTAAPSGALTYNGTGTITKGTGLYKGAKGSFTFNGGAPAGTDKDGDTDAIVATFTAAGTIKY